MGMLKELLQSIWHPQEIGAMFKVKYGGIVPQEYDEPLDVLATKLKDLEFCYAVLNKVSRSFAVVIQQLPPQLKDPVCIFYLVLRGLDSVEDDMDFPQSQKLPMLVSFHQKLLLDGWNIAGVGDSPDYRILLANFEKVIRVFKGLNPKYQHAIKDICARMGKGMAEFAEKKVTTVAGYNLYCHYVAGLVGYGLSDLFSASGLEDDDLQHQHQLSNSMGLFLQKTNIIRDYLEDLDSGRTFWPDEIWKKYANDLGHFKANPTAHESVSCLNHMVMDALQHVPDSLIYLTKIKNPHIFRFCAIPQVMAVATLAAVYNNPRVFSSVVKIRKGLSCKLMLDTNNINAVRDYFRTFIMSMARRVPSNDPNAQRTHDLIDQVKSLTAVPIPKFVLRVASVIAWLVLLLASFYLLSQYRSKHFGLHLTETSNSGMNTTDFAVLISSFLSIAYLFGFFGVQYV